MSCTALTSLTLHFTLEGYPSSGSSVSQSIFTNVLDLLSTLPPTAPLSSLTFNIVFLGEDEESQLGELDWAGLREILRRRKELREMLFWSFDARLAERVGCGSVVESWGIDASEPVAGSQAGSRTIGESRRRMIERELEEWKESGVLCIR